MIPIRSTIKTEIVPYVNCALLAVNVLVFAYTLFLTGEALQTFYQTHGIVPSKITALETYGFLDRTAKYFSSMFIHENWIHMGGNLIFLYIFGNAIDGPLAGKNLAPVVHGNHFWFAWAVFKPDTILYQGEYGA